MATPTELSYRHAIYGDEADATVCGIQADDTTDDLQIACNCHATLCELPVTCPACIAILAGRAN